MKRGSIVVIATSLVLGFMPPAAAGPGQIGLSWDGRRWHSSLQGELFDPAHRWVPGESGTRTFWLRNGADEPAELRVHFDVVEAGLRVPEDLRISVQVADQAWRPLRDARGGNWLAEQRVPAGGAIRYRVRGDFAWGSTAERVGAQLAIRAVLAGTDAGQLDDSADAGAGLPSVGNRVGAVTVLGALVAVGWGVLLLRRRRAGGAR